jgi:hypothetical protein
MRPTTRYSIVASTAALLLTGLMTGTAGAAAAQNQVTGSGMIDFGGLAGQVIINAHGTVNDAHGNIKFRIPDFPAFADAEATVTCLNVVGNTAILSGPVKNPDPASGFAFMQATVVDNGTPGNGVGPDLADATLADFELGCAFTFSGAISAAQQGNFTVKDR